MHVNDAPAGNCLPRKRACICLFASDNYDANLGSSFPTSASVFQDRAHFMINDILFSVLEKLQRMQGGWYKAMLLEQNSHFTRSKRTPIQSKWVYSFILQWSRENNQPASFAHHLDNDTNPFDTATTCSRVLFGHTSHACRDDSSFGGIDCQSRPAVWRVSFSGLFWLSVMPELSWFPDHSSLLLATLEPPPLLFLHRPFSLVGQVSSTMGTFGTCSSCGGLVYRKSCWKWIILKSERIIHLPLVAWAQLSILTGCSRWPFGHTCSMIWHRNCT